jgi:hypothetical protein
MNGFRRFFQKIPGIKNLPGVKAPATQQGSAWQLRPSDGQGPFTAFFKSWVPRKVEAEFYEFLREAIPVIDAAICRLVALDGHVVVKGKNAKLVAEIQEWMDTVKVNDIQSGLQAFHQNFTNEAFEQGFSIGEFVTDKKRTDIVELRVADSKSIKFSRKPTGGLGIYQKADGDREERELAQDNLVYFSINNENQNPYGTPLMRSCEFVAQTLVTIQNATKNVWERFGDPSFSIIYKTSKKDGADLEARRQKIEEEFTTAIRAKRDGKSADFIRAIDSNSEIKIEIIGHDGQVMEMEIPARHMLEQIIAKTGLPPWMLGMHWSTSERLSNAELAILLADIGTRQAAKMPLFKKLVTTMLQLRGRTWKDGDWELDWGKVNLHDVVQQAQARFLNAQADMYYMQNAAAAGITIDINDLALGKEYSTVLPGKKKFLSEVPHSCSDKACGCKIWSTKELARPWAWEELDRIEESYEAVLMKDWDELLTRFKALLNLEIPQVKGVDIDGGFTFGAIERASLMAALKAHLAEYSPDLDSSPLRRHYMEASALGIQKAIELLGHDTPILNIVSNSAIYDELLANGFDLVKDNATKAIVSKILPEIEAYALAGVNPGDVARRLEKLFGDANSDWNRLARSELAIAAEKAKLAEWAEWDVAIVEFVPAPDACPICFNLGGDYAIAETPVPVIDTHPYCRCSTRPAESEVTG